MIRPTVSPPVLILITFLSTGSFHGQQAEQRNAPSTPFEMQAVVERHARWLASGGAEGARADLWQITLEGINGGLRFILSSGVVLRGVDLRRGDFRQARMRGVDLSDARLDEADFRESNLRWAVFDGAELGGTDFREANLNGSFLREANVHGTLFDGADLRGADLSGARCLTASQLETATVDEHTQLPAFEDCR